jgi:hypothetical protein
MADVAEEKAERLAEQIFLKLDPELIAFIRSSAKQTGRTLSSQVAYLLWPHVEVWGNDILGLYDADDEIGRPWRDKLGLTRDDVARWRAASERAWRLSVARDIEKAEAGEPVRRPRGRPKKSEAPAEKAPAKKTKGGSRGKA